ncbi:hypothetical protein I7I53_10563 [Histoplasma capsulatum var. duboisii H88]|uniref:Uncharacterized protein n=1 Tax=Ajellomyces capsulatus (strain H88) TaxID=544711 RepID=A0A8A1L6J8_AJEC8|nr:hypothetical protein I7I53_10563 [Histoplasma capsulatum var. duboisii H88]
MSVYAPANNLHFPQILSNARPGTQMLLYPSAIPLNIWATFPLHQEGNSFRPLNLMESFILNVYI